MNPPRQWVLGTLRIVLIKVTVQGRPLQWLLRKWMRHSDGFWWHEALIVVQMHFEPKPVGNFVAMVCRIPAFYYLLTIVCFTNIRVLWDWGRIYCEQSNMQEFSSSALQWLHLKLFGFWKVWDVRWVSCSSRCADWVTVWHTVFVRSPLCGLADKQCR